MTIPYAEVEVGNGQRQVRVETHPQGGKGSPVWLYPSEARDLAASLVAAAETLQPKTKCDLCDPYDCDNCNICRNSR